MKLHQKYKELDALLIEDDRIFAICEVEPQLENWDVTRIIQIGDSDYSVLYKISKMGLWLATWHPNRYLEFHRSIAQLIIYFNPSTNMVWCLSLSSLRENEAMLKPCSMKKKNGLVGYLLTEPWLKRHSIFSRLLEPKALAKAAQ